MGKEEIARYEQFLFFPQCFQRLSDYLWSKGLTNFVKRRNCTLKCRLQFCFNLNQSKTLLSGNGSNSFETNEKTRESRAKSDYTFVHADLILHTPQNRSMVTSLTNGRFVKITSE